MSALLFYCRSSECDVCKLAHIFHLINPSLFKLDPSQSSPYDVIMKTSLPQNISVIITHVLNRNMPFPRNSFCFSLYDVIMSLFLFRFPGETTTTKTGEWKIIYYSNLASHLWLQALMPEKFGAFDEIIPRNLNIYPLRMCVWVCWDGKINLASDLNLAVKITLCVL